MQVCLFHIRQRLNFWWIEWRASVEYRQSPGFYYKPSEQALIHLSAPTASGIYLYKRHQEK